MNKLPQTSNSVHAAQLIEFAANTRCADIPSSAIANARRCLIDGIGCGLFGASQPWSQIMAAQLFAEKSQGASTLLGHAAPLSAPAAALANGTAIHGFELDDLLPAAIIHPGTVIIPALLAVAEAENVTGDALLRAIAIGYEVTARISIAMGQDASHLGFHKTSVVGPVASSIAVGTLLGLKAAQITCAAGIAASMASGVKAYVASAGGGMVKRMHAGWAAQSGVRAALLAREGFTGPSGAVDGRYGLLEVFGGKAADATRLAAGLNESWAIDSVWFKVYPMCGWIQGVSQLLTAMRVEITGGKPLQADQIKKITVGTSAFAVNGNSNYTPEDTMDAQYSIPYCAGLALTGDPGDPRAFEPAVFNTAAARDLAQRVEIIPDDECEAVYPARFGSRVTLHMVNGVSKSALTLDPHGTPADPCTDAELAAKFQRLAGLSPLHVDGEAIARWVAAMDANTRMSQLSRLLRSQ